LPEAFYADFKMKRRKGLSLIRIELGSLSTGSPVSIKNLFRGSYRDVF
jgi:hypothetical protein